MKFRPPLAGMSASALVALRRSAILKSTGLARLKRSARRHDDAAGCAIRVSSIGRTDSSKHFFATSRPTPTATTKRIGNAAAPTEELGGQPKRGALECSQSPLSRIPSRSVTICPTAPSRVRNAGHGTEDKVCCTTDSVSFQIPEKTLSPSLGRLGNAEPAYWSHTLYRGPNKEHVIVHYCKTKTTVEKVAQLFLGKEVLGFDMEWAPYATGRSGPKANASLIQLACEERIALFHIAMHSGSDLDSLVAPTLKRILESSETVKTGVAIRADCTRLEKWLNIRARGIFELSHLHKLVEYGDSEPAKVNKQLVSLARMVETHLHLPLFKGKVRYSDWSKGLDYEQVTYAAADAYACLRIGDILERKRLAMDPTPPRPALYELDLPIVLPRGPSPDLSKHAGSIDCGSKSDSEKPRPSPNAGNINSAKNDNTGDSTTPRSSSPNVSVADGDKASGNSNPSFLGRLRGFF